ncbi:unnamed protein product [Trifolium pratense]|uniref:Uncharacterized protein n=1 Tax=Trifolium pratense TaxID=57577 RepID=A0ACB0KP59_TRIPR|nr:unnamed protein product [Trifolium pratense]
MTELFFDDFFKVEGLNPYNEKYDKGERFLLALSPSLVLNTKDGPVSIQEKFEYIMHGRLYDITSYGLSLSPPEVEVYASYGGLQMMLRGDPSHCVKFAVDQNLYLLIRKA